MKKLLLLILIISSVLCSAQRTFKITLIDAKTSKPMAKKWFTVLKNRDEYITFTHTDSNGIGTFQIRGYDSTATYQAEIVNRWDNAIKSGMYDITEIKNGQSIIKVQPVEASMPFGCGEVMYPSYRPKEPYSIHDLPEDIQRKVKTLLINRTGEKFYHRLILNGGQVINLKRLYAVVPSAKLWKYVPPIYSLCFTILDSTKHSSLYSFILKLDKQGNVIGEIELPDIKHNTSKSTIITMEAAKQIAAANNFYDVYTNVKSRYYSKTGAIVWEVEQTDPGEGTKERRILFIDASNGSVLAKLTTQIEVMY